jgi:hypothetical protein
VKIAAIFLLTSLSVATFCIVSCSDNGAASTRLFINNLGLAGISSTNAVQSASSYALNNDYRNRFYYALINMGQGNFESFIKNNNFEKESVLALPVSGGDLKTPVWWDAPKLQNELYSKKMTNVTVIVMWRNNQVFLFASD